MEALGNPDEPALDQSIESRIQIIETITQMVCEAHLSCRINANRIFGGNDGLEAEGGKAAQPDNQIGRLDLCLDALDEQARLAMSQSARFNYL